MSQSQRPAELRSTMFFKPHFTIFFATSLIAAVIGAGCNDANITIRLPADDLERELPAGSAPPLPGLGPDMGMPPPVIEGPAPVPCCEVTFAIRDADGVEGEVSARLRGSAPPLDEEGVALTYQSGVWSGSACMPIDYDGFYYYEFGLSGDNDPGAIFYVTDANVNAPLTASALIDPVNSWTPLSSCADDVSAHSDTTER